MMAAGECGRMRLWAGGMSPGFARLNRRRRARRGASLALMLALPALNGCLWHTRRVPQATMPENVLSAEPEQLVDIINKQYDAVQSLSATVTFTATQGGTLKGVETTYTSFSGYILLRKPGSLRVIGFLPVVHTRAFDMASDGKTFQLWIPPKNKVVEGTNAEPVKPSTNTFENMRPYIFFDSLLIRKIDPDEELLPTSDSDTEVNPRTKKLEIDPQYVLTVLSRQGESNIVHARRVIHFSRIDLRPVEEDIYDQNGQVQTIATYGPMQTFGTEHFPGTITIKRPLDQYRILVTLQKLTVNQPLNDEQFQLTIPEGTPVQKLP
jgi:outer membrane lipoprotein-sorting protein